jgi:hypothetical protein
LFRINTCGSVDSRDIYSCYYKTLPVNVDCKGFSIGVDGGRGREGFNAEVTGDTEMARRNKAEGENIARRGERRGAEVESRMGANYQRTG